MGILEILLVAVGLSLDVFAYCLYKGAMLSALHREVVVKTILLFTVCQSLGLLLGNAVTLVPFLLLRVRRANRTWICVSGIIFLALGIYMLIKAYRNSAHTIFERKNDRFEMRVMLIWALLASCDAVAAGIGFGFLAPALVMTVVTVAAATALTVAIGLICGFLLGCGPMNKCVAIGGALVIIGGVDVLLHYIMIR